MTILNSKSTWVQIHQESNLYKQVQMAYCLALLASSTANSGGPAKSKR